MASLAGVPAVNRQREGVRSEAVAAVVLVAFLAAAPFLLYPVFVMKALCFALFACAFNLLIGYVGLLSFGHALFFGWSSYLAAYAAQSWAMPPGLAIIVGTATAAVLGIIAGLIAIRRQGIYFAMITLALAQMMYLVALRAKLTGGEDGIQLRPRGRLFGVFDLNNEMTMYAFVVVAVLAALFLIYRIINSPFGEVLKAIRENEQRSISLGYSTDRYKLVAFVLSATLAGLAGSLKAMVFQLASLTDVHWTMSGEVVLMTLVGGLGTIFGPVVGRLLHRRHGKLSGAVRPMGACDPGRYLRRLRAHLPSGHRRRACTLAAGQALEHDPEKWSPVFGQDHAQPIKGQINFPRCYQQTKSQQIVLAAATFILIAESTKPRCLSQKRRF